MAYVSNFKSSDIEHKLGLVHGVPTLDHVPTGTDLSYTDDVLGEVTFNVGDKVRYYDSASGVYKMYILMNVEEGSADWQEMTMGVSI